MPRASAFAFASRVHGLRTGTTPARSCTRAIHCETCLERGAHASRGRAHILSIVAHVLSRGACPARSCTYLSNVAHGYRKGRMPREVFHICFIVKRCLSRNACLARSCSHLLQCEMWLKQGACPRGRAHICFNVKCGSSRCACPARCARIPFETYVGADQRFYVLTWSCMWE